jgi:16S rRNA (uracil1498-N3)-methyltransferase
LPRTFLPGASPDGPIELPADELQKLRHVLRMSTGDKIGILPDDGTLIVCEIRGRSAEPQEVVTLDTEPSIKLTLAQALPKGDKVDDIVRMCTGIGVSRFVLFASERTVVKWDERKRADRMRRLGTIAREEAEVSFRARVPSIEWGENLVAVLRDFPQAMVLSEVEGLETRLEKPKTEATIVVGPEGGWAPGELDLIADRGVSLGKRVLRVEHAGAAAAAILLLS